MADFFGFQDLKKLAEGRDRIVYSALRLSDHKPVVLKTISSEHPSEDMIALMYHEYEISKDLSLPGVIRTYDFINQQNQFFLVQEDIHGISLRDYLHTNPITDLSIFLSFAIKMLDPVSDLHKHQIIHKDIKPSNFIINPETLMIRLTDFNFSTKLLHETQEIVPPENLEGTLAYMAPEQTGRMNMNIDYRSDFYALGVTFYEMLCGELPFSYDDPLELLHALLANPAPLVASTKINIPPTLGKIVQKLMEKNPKDRYQSAIGIKADLEQCQKMLKKIGKIDFFPLGQDDVLDHLNLSQKLYGRESEAKILLEAFHRASRGAVEALMISGYAGIGKSMLINEVRKPMAQHDSYFISGKFDQLQLNMPYKGITQALNELARLLLAEPDDRFEMIKNEIKETLGDVGQIILDLAPEMELILGPQEPLEELPPQETQNRMVIFFKRFLKAIANQDHPLVIFLDDLQWIDASSLKLFEYILTDKELSHILLIGAYRENEVDEHHPLIQFYKAMQSNKTKISSLKLAPLTLEDFEKFFKDSFNRLDMGIKPFSVLLHKRTNGNLFFAKQILNTLYEEKLLYFDYKKNQWDWNLEAIKSLKITDNIADILLHRISELPEETQSLLKYAACVGIEFTIETLMATSGKSPKEIDRVLWPALQEELIFAPRQSYKRMAAMHREVISDSLSTEIIYQFSHDRVKQALYQKIPLIEKQKNHLIIARMMMRRDPEAIKQHLFEIVDHFNVARNWLKPEEKKLAAELNYEAGMLAKTSNAFHPMTTYLKIAMELLGEEAWTNNYDKIFAISREYALSLFLLNKVTEAEALTSELLNRAKTDLNKISLYILQIACYQLLAQTEKGLIIGSQALALLGIHFPTKASRMLVRLKLAKIYWRMRSFNIETLEKELPSITNPSIIAAFDILTPIIGVAFWKSPFLHQYLILTAVDLMLQYGKPKGAGFWFLMYASIILRFSNNVDRAFKFRNLGMRLLNEHLDKFTASIGISATAYLKHFRFPIKSAEEDYQLAIQYGAEAGNIFATPFSTGSISINRLAEAKSLRNTVDLLESVYKAYNNVGLVDSAHLAEVNYLALKNLELGEQEHSDELKELEEKIAKSDNTFVKINHFKRLSFYYYFMERYEDAISFREYWYAEKDSLRFNTLSFEIKSLGGLALLRCMTNASFLNKFHYKRLIRRILRDLKWVSKESPENFLHHYLFLSASLHYLRGHYKEALQEFNLAIKNAKEGDFYLWVALGNELAGDMITKEEGIRCAIEYIREAHYYYARFGMSTKVKSIEKQHPEYFRGWVQTQPLYTSSATTSASLDLMSVIKASQAISGEIVLSELFEKMLFIVLENAGAERALFLEPIKNNWTVTAKLEFHEKKPEFSIINLASNQFPDLPQKVIQFSLRSKESVVLNNATQDNQYRFDPYISRAKPKSVLCLPILRHEKVLGIIYLENNLTVDAFTKDRVTVLITLASQIAISLENARNFQLMQNLYKSTERFVPKQFLEILHRKNIEEIRLGDSLRLNVSVLFADIRGFTTLLERLEPEVAFALVNRYWAITAPAIQHNHGFICQYQGDGLLALFSGKADDALAAGETMLSRLIEFNQEQRKIKGPELDIGVGIHSGSAMIGIIGVQERLEPTIISDIANAASRVETLNRTYETHFLLSGQTFKALQDPDKYSIRRVDKVRLKGRVEVTNLHEFIDWELQLKKISLEKYLSLFNDAFTDYEKGEFTKAKEKFANCLRFRPSDKAAEILRARCEEFVQNGPPKTWDGVYTFTHK